MDRILVENVQRLRKEGKSFGDIAKELLITKSQACYCNKIDIEECDKKLASHDKYVKSVCELAQRCTNINQILHILGKKNTNEYYLQIRKILNENKIDTSHFIENKPFKPSSVSKKQNIEFYLVSGSTIASCKLRDKILKEGIKEHKCERCGRTEWEGNPIPLQLHHINGDKTDNRIENLQILCPNCHTLTDNYCGKKLKKELHKCAICGKEIHRQSIYCVDCYNKYIRKGSPNEFKKKTFKNKNNQEIVYPTKEELINDFKDLGSFRAVGNKYGLTDVAIVKWCKKYELPIKAKEMRFYIKNIFGEVKWNFSNGNEKILREYQRNNYKRVNLLDDFGNVEKTYSSPKELIDDGFDPKNVYRVCRGEAKIHHKRKFKFY